MPGQVPGKKLCLELLGERRKQKIETVGTTAFKVHLNNTEACLANTDGSGLFPLAETTVKFSDFIMRSNTEPISSLSNSDSNALKHPVPLSMHHKTSSWCFSTIKELTRITQTIAYLDQQGQCKLNTQKWQQSFILPPQQSPQRTNRYLQPRHRVEACFRFLTSRNSHLHSRLCKQYQEMCIPYTPCLSTNNSQNAESPLSGQVRLNQSQNKDKNAPFGI